MPSAVSSCASCDWEETSWCVSSWTIRCWREVLVWARARRESLIAAPPPAGRGQAGVVEQRGEQGLLGVQAVLRLVPDHGGGAVDDLCGDLLAAVGGQAVQEQTAGEVHELLGDLVRGEGLLAPAVLALLPHG